MQAFVKALEQSTRKSKMMFFDVSNEVAFSISSHYFCYA
jgi:hypothetical protein